MRDKNLFIDKPFLIKYFRFQFIFYVKTPTPLKKVTPVKPLLFENLVECLTPRHPPPAEREEGCTLRSLFELKYTDTIDMNTII